MGKGEKGWERERKGGRGRERMGEGEKGWERERKDGRGRERMGEGEKGWERERKGGRGRERVGKGEKGKDGKQVIWGENDNGLRTCEMKSGWPGTASTHLIVDFVHVQPNHRLQGLNEGGVDPMFP